MSFQKGTKIYKSLEQTNTNGVLKVEVVNPSTLDYTALLTSIDGKLDELALIKAELITSNSTLTNIETNTDTTNTKLDTVITKLDSQITLLTDLKATVEAGNLKLDSILAKLGDILVSVDAIKVDIAEIKIDIEAIKTSVASIDTKLTSVIDSLTEIETKLDSVITELQTINTTLQTEFDETQVKLDSVIEALEFAQDTFQVKDCTGVNVGTPENVIKVVQLAKQTTDICNTSDITTPIVNAINNQSVAGKKQDFLSWTAVANDTLTIPLNKFSTIAMLASKGEFKIENMANNFSSDITISSGTLSNFIEISEDGIGTATGSTSVAQSFDTRANIADMDVANNSFLITCVRPGTIQLEIYK